MLFFNKNKKINWGMLYNLLRTIALCVLMESFSEHCPNA